MVGFFKYQNVGADLYYLERCVNDLEASPNQLPIPNSYTDTMKHIEDYEKDSTYKKLKRIPWVCGVALIGSLFI